MKLDELCVFSCLKYRYRMLVLMTMCMLYQNLSLCWSLNNEGLALLKLREKVVDDPFDALSNWNSDDGEMNPCSWFGVECFDGKVVVLDLKNLCLGGTLAPEVQNLVHIKSIIVRNNSFFGIIPDEIGELEELEVLDLGYNNFSGPIPFNIVHNLPLTVLLLEHSGILGNLSFEHDKLKIISEIQADKKQPTSTEQRSSCDTRYVARGLAQNKAAVRVRRELASTSAGSISPPPESPPPPKRQPSQKSPPPPKIPPPSKSTKEPLAIPPPSPLPLPPPSPSPSVTPSSSPTSFAPSPSPVPNPKSTSPSPNLPSSKPQSKNNLVLIMATTIGGSVLIFMLVMGLIFFNYNKVITIQPWATGLSGQLQKAFVTGVPNLKRSDLEAACEDFSNVIGSSSIGTLYKGTLSNGVEIAVTSVDVKSSRDWSRNLEVQFRKKIDTLSKVNHKNFVSLIGYCREEKPFARMMIFEYAPNGTLFEHLHIKEAEHLNWAMRLRIAVGISYCLEHMHQLTPQISHRNLTSSSVSLTEDYAAKISDFTFWNEAEASNIKSSRTELLSATPESNVYSFGALLFEMVTGTLPFSVNNNTSLDDWALASLNEDQPFTEMVDPTLNSFKQEQVDAIYEVIKYCVHHDPKQRPSMKEVTARLKEITGIGSDGAAPRLSPLWWAELEIMSNEGN